MSLYLTYVVPTQGRENEIEHMQEVERFFTDQKMNMDSLWYNNQIGVPFNQNLQLGTGGPKTAGSFSVFGIMQPIAATGSASVKDDEPTVTLVINGIWEGGTLTDPDILGTVQVNEPNTQLNINYQTGENSYTPYILVLQSTKGDWSAKLQVQKNEYITAQNISFDMDETTKVVSNLKIEENPDYYVTLSVIKKGILTFDNMVINSEIRNIGEIIRVDILDESYGLNADIEFPFAVTYQYFDLAGTPIPSTSLPSPFTIQGYSDDVVTTRPIPIGGLFYESSNNYWINQKYSYQLGGVFLGQDGLILPKINPWIKVKESSGADTPGTSRSIMDISLDLMSINRGNSSISGADSVQVLSKISDIRDELVDGGGTVWTLSKFRPNARTLTMKIRHSPDENLANSWYQTFERNFRDANITKTYYGIDLSSDSPGEINGIDVNFFGEKADDSLDLYIDYSLIETEISISSTFNIK